MINRSPHYLLTDIDAVFFDVGDTIVFDNPGLPDRLQSALEAIHLTISLPDVERGIRQVETYFLVEYCKGVDVESLDFHRQTARVMSEELGLGTRVFDRWHEFADKYFNMPCTRYVHPSAVPLLRDLRARGLKLGAVSDWDSKLPQILSDLDILNDFDAVSVSDIVGARKPNPQLFLHAAESVGVAPERCLHIGDLYELDSAGASSAGMNWILYDWRHRTDGSLGPTVRTFEELTEQLNVCQPLHS